MKKPTVLKLLILIIAIHLHNKQFCYAKYFEISGNGYYQTSYSSNYKNLRTMLGIEVGIPIGSFFEISLGRNFTKDIYEYSNDYKIYLESKGLALPSGTLTQENFITDTYANLGIGLYGWYISPSLFGGVLERRVCSEDFFKNSTCKNQDMTWNAGATLSIFLTRYLKLKSTYRISPSNAETNESDKYNDYISLGITLSM